MKPATVLIWPPTAASPKVMKPKPMHEATRPSTYTTVRICLLKTGVYAVSGVPHRPPFVSAENKPFQLF